MWWLSRHASSRQRDKGAVTALVAVLLSSGVIMGMLALTVDVGNIMSERRQLQNGADSATFALAGSCSKTPLPAGSECASAATASASLKSLAGANSVDQLQSVPAGTICGVNVPTLPTCVSTGSATNLADCLPKPTSLAAGIPYVETRTTTLTSGGGSTLASFFAKSLIAGYQDKQYAACSRVAWGPPASYAAAVPIVISECEWKLNTNNGAVYQSAPGPTAPGYGSSAGQTPWPSASSQITIYLKTTTSAPCAINGKDTSGGFGYVVDATGNCQAQISSNDWAQIDTGSSAPNGCTSVVSGLRGTVINLPVFDCLVRSASQPTGGISGYPDCTGNSGGGNNSWYHVVGWAKFYLTGYKIGGSQQAASLLTGSVPCTGGDRCLSGWFVSGTLDAPSIVPPTGFNNFGAYAFVSAG